jgi:hypothetical protein
MVKVSKDLQHDRAHIFEQTRDAVAKWAVFWPMELPRWSAEFAAAVTRPHFVKFPRMGLHEKMSMLQGAWRALMFQVRLHVPNKSECASQPKVVIFNIY